MKHNGQCAGAGGRRNDTFLCGQNATPRALRAEMEAEVGKDVDGVPRAVSGPKLPYEDSKRSEISRCHLYLTMPFVFCHAVPVEAMAHGADDCRLLDCAPLREAITHGRNPSLLSISLIPMRWAIRGQKSWPNPGAIRAFRACGTGRICASKTYGLLSKCLPRTISRQDELALRSPRPANPTCPKTTTYERIVPWTKTLLFISVTV